MEIKQEKSEYFGRNTRARSYETAQVTRLSDSAEKLISLMLK